MAELPPPIVSAEVDLRGMEFMPLKGDILFKSTTWLKGSHEARSAALRLWWHSFAHEVPAASLPDDDQLLAEYAGYGEVVKAWLKIKPQAMRGWVKCDDGRLYHKIVAELALEAWKGRVKNREKVRKWREKKAAENPPGNGGGNGHDDGPVTVIPPVRNSLKGEREGQSEGERQLIEEAIADLPPDPPCAAAQASEPMADHLAIPDFLRRTGTPIARSISPDWLPSQSAQDELAKARPDLTPEIVQTRMVEFRNWCAEKATQTHNPDATWFGFMRKTHVQQPARAHQVHGEPTELDGVAAAFARRSFQPG